MQEVLQRLRVGPWDAGPQFDERLVVLARQEQPNQVLPQRYWRSATGAALLAQRYWRSARRSS
jgi:hypothetical protein